MLDIRFIRENLEVVEDSLRRRGASVDLAGLLELDEQRRGLVGRIDEMRNDRNTASKAIGAARQRGEDAAAEMTRVRDLGDDMARIEVDLAEMTSRLDVGMLTIPNIVQPDVPTGGEDEGTEVRTWGTPRIAEIGDVRDHLDIGTELGVIDMERGARTSGSRFAYLLGDAVRVQFALVQFALDLVTGAGFLPVVPPVLVREEALWGTGFFPVDRSQIYRIPEENADLFLVGTSEVPLAALHMDEILEPEQLPLRYAGISSCFRREAGTAGKDTRGIFRVHQFDKVEMFSFTEPDASSEEHEFILAQEEAIMQALELPYRVINIAAGDLGSPASKKYDIEVWLPAQQRFRELTSASNCTDYQARRLKARVRREKGTEMVHTLNGTAIAIGRTMIALMENHQDEHGVVHVPEALRKYGAPATFRSNDESIADAGSFAAR
ncbi:MAG: serine--tRNA ligase [Thermoleophilia bacterium]|nr:serine--tRNA ligase [Thermoleophilia bacterium]